MKLQISGAKFQKYVNILKTGFPHKDNERLEDIIYATVVLDSFYMNQFLFVSKYVQINPLMPGDNKKVTHT